MKFLLNQKENLPAAILSGRKFLKTLFTLISISFIVSCQKDIMKNLDNPAIDGTTTSEKTEALSVPAGANNTYFVSPSGNDNNDGSINTPWLTWEFAWSKLSPGDILYIRGGTYRQSKSAATSVQITWGNKNGKSGNLIAIFNYPGETPVMDFSDVLHTSSGVYGISLQSSSYIHVKGLRITGLAQSPTSTVEGFALSNCNNVTIENCVSDYMGGSPFTLLHCTNSTMLNCDASNSGDKYNNYEGANGFQITGAVNTSNNITLEGCRAWWICDDGFDFFGLGGAVTLKNCWSFWNGYAPGSKSTYIGGGADGNGFKIGPGNGDVTTIKRTFNNCLSFENYAVGFEENWSTGNRFPAALYNCVAFGNAYPYDFTSDRRHIFTNNIDYANDKGRIINAQAVQTTNSWQGGITVTNSDFASVSSSGMNGARQSDGSLPVLTFLHLAQGSDLINAGTNVGLPFSGSSPDLGAFESGLTSTTTNQAPVANAGTDKNLTLPANNTSLTGSGSDPDGTITSYSWSVISGPNTPTLSGTTGTTLSVSNLIAGTYSFRLTVTDNLGLTASDDVSVIVNSIGTIPVPVPVPVPIPQGTNIINLSQVVHESGYSYITPQNFGIPADDQANPARSVLHIFENNIELLPPHSVHNDIRNSGKGRFSHWSNGSYTLLYFSASDNSNPKTNGRVYTYSFGSISSNQPPVANAGSDKNITLPANSTSLTGSGNDPDGTINSYSWSVISGPNTPILSAVSGTTLSVSNLIAGTYIFRLTVKDNLGLTASDDASVIVNTATVTPPTPTPIPTQPGTHIIDLSQVVPELGFSYYTPQNFGIPADDQANPARSVLRIFENNIELLPPHSAHNDIRKSGKGRFSHWSNGSYILLYFSASDNSDPRTNGRVYTYSTN